MKITKKEFIEKLYEIEEKYDLKLGKEVQKVIRNEIVPIDVIKLINKYDKDFLRIYDTLNVIYEARKRNPLYRNLRNRNLNLSEKVIALSSFITKILISCSKIDDKDEKKILAKAMNLDEINNAINEYIFNDNDTYIIEYSNQIADLLEILYVD